MNTVNKILSVLAISLGCTLQAQASALLLNADGLWNEFNIDDLSSVSQGVEWIDADDSNSPDFGTARSYHFTITHGFTGFLSVVDAGIAGDRFEIFNYGQSIGTTSATTNDTDFSNDFSNNINNAHFSSGIFTLGQGTYAISGKLLSTLQPFNATNGALKLEVSKNTVPEPATYLLLLSGLGLIVCARRRV